LESRGPLKLTMNTESVAVAVAEVKEKTQAFALCAPSFESSLNSTVTAGITAGRQPSFAQRELSSAGWVWLGNEVLSIVERLPKKCRPSVRSVLLAYAQLSSRRGNARTFPAAASLVARIAGCSVSTVHVADNYLKAAGIITVRKQRHSTGHDAPRLVSLCEVEAAPPEVFEIVPVDHLPEVRKYRSRQSKNLSDTGVRVAHSKSDTLKKLLKENPTNNSLSTTPRRRPPAKAEREGWEDCELRLAREHGMDIDEVRRLRAKHEANMGKLSSGAYATPENFSRNFATLKAKHQKHEARKKWYWGCNDPSDYGDDSDKGHGNRYHGVGNPACYHEPEVKRAAANGAVAERTRWFNQFAATTPNVPSTWDEATDAIRMQFMASNEGASFLALAESRSARGAYFAIDQETGAVAAK
jgi:hypothetical protein